MTPTMRRWVTALCAVFCLAAATPAGAVTMPRFADGYGLHVVSAKQLSPRLFAVTLTTPLLTAPANVRILLPNDYDAHPKTHYPVLWLFHGTSGGAADWTASPGRAQDITNGLPLITVMPDAGVNSNGGGWFTNWVNGGKYGPPEWETFHIDRLIPWIDSSLRTIKARRGRAIAGLSQGGFGAMSYAARHPDLFQAAISFSGAVDIADHALEADPLVSPIILATEVGLDQVAPDTFFGSRLTNEINWAAHDPATLASNLRGMNLYAYTGNGLPGPFDGGSNYNAGAAVIESGVHELSSLFHESLEARDIPIDYHDYGGGTHSWPYWQRDLQDVIGPLMRDFANPDPSPATVDYECDLAHYEQWGWTVDVHRPAVEFSTLSNATRRGFSLSGSGSANVTTPARYRPKSNATITVTGATVRKTLKTRVDKHGRLTIAVPLGPGNASQQYALGAVTHSYTTRVTITAPRRR